MYCVIDMTFFLTCLLGALLIFFGMWLWVTTFHGICVCSFCMWLVLTWNHALHLSSKGQRSFIMYQSCSNRFSHSHFDVISYIYFYLTVINNRWRGINYAPVLYYITSNLVLLLPWYCLLMIIWHEYKMSIKRDMLSDSRYVHKRVMTENMTLFSPPVLTNIIGLHF